MDCEFEFYLVQRYKYYMRCVLIYNLSPLIQSLAEEEIISIPNFFFFIMPSSCFLTDAPVLPVPLPTCSLALNTLSNRPAESAVAVDRALLTDWLGAKERTVVAIVKVTVSAANTRMICSLFYFCGKQDEVVVRFAL